MNIRPAQILLKVREQKPVVHHLTNWVTIYDCAQVVKSLGASPVMAHAPEEMADMVQIASAVVLNIGTLTREFVASMVVAGRSANERGIPVVLDACGAGATRLRDSACQQLLEDCRISILKGNQSEIARVAGQDVRTHGVDAGEVHNDVVQLARDTARAFDLAVVVTGEQDVISDGRITCLVNNGTPLMAHVVGTGCMAASVIGAFAAVEPTRPALAAAGALVCYEVAAELAAEQSDGPLAFKSRIFDSLYRLDDASIESRQKLTMVEYGRG